MIVFLFLQVGGHLDYSDKMDIILKEMGLKQKVRRSSNRLAKLTKFKVSSSNQPPVSQEDPAEESLCIDAKDLNLSPTRKKMEEAAGVSSQVSKSPSLNLTESKAKDEKNRSQSMMNMATRESSEETGTREDFGSFHEDTVDKNCDGNPEMRGFSSKKDTLGSSQDVHSSKSSKDSLDTARQMSMNDDPPLFQECNGNGQISAWNENMMQGEEVESIEI